MCITEQANGTLDRPSEKVEKGSTAQLATIIKMLPLDTVQFSSLKPLLLHK